MDKPNEAPAGPPPIDKLAAALAKAQATIEGAHKDTDNPFFKSKYADLGSCWAACRKPLSDNGLAVIQIPSTDGNLVTVRTILMHSSGQSVEGLLSVQNKNQQNPSQGIGSCITYLRRYALCGFVGISPEDDDGNSAGGGSDRPAPLQPDRPAREPAQSNVPPPPSSGPSEAQLKRLYAITAKSSWSPEDVKAIMKKKYNVNSSTELTKDQYQEICDALIKETL